jgi:hypothetical protein
VEGQSHHAEILYRYGFPDVAYAQLIDLTREDRARRDYPEVAYSVVGAIVTGMMGVTVEPVSPMQAAMEGTYVDRIVRTLSALVPQTEWAELRNLPIRANRVSVRHEEGRSSVFTNQEGPALIWQATFAGSFDTLLVDGRPVRSHPEKGYLGREFSWVRTPVGSGRTVRIEIPQERSPTPKSTVRH